MRLSPVVLFVYNRPWHTEQTVNALKNNELANESDLFIFSDGPKTENDENVKKVREYIKTIDGFKLVTIIEREKNLGLANSVIAGVTEIVNKFGKVIVLEDDLVTSRYFLKFMNEALEKYEDEEKVISIHGYMYPVKEKLPETFFLKGADCWGWATWKRGWNLFNPNGKELLDKIEKQGLQKEFDFYGAYPYTNMLRDQIESLNNSWAVRWYASAFLNDKLTLYPSRSLINNIGVDDSGVHCTSDNKYENNIADSSVEIITTLTEEDPAIRKIISEFLKNNGSRSIIAKIKDFMTSGRIK